MAALLIYEGMLGYLTILSSGRQVSIFTNKLFVAFSSKFLMDREPDADHEQVVETRVCGHVR
jgi:hypothetical protein